MKAKTHLSQNKSRGGFTLVEMLVVIGMIATLAGISFPVYKSIQKKVDKQQFEMTINAFERAIDNHELEYNYLPYVGNAYPNADQEYVHTTSDVTAFTSVLVGLESICNFKKINFFEASEPKGGPGNYKNGLLIDGNNATYYLPWGGEIFIIVVDHNKDGVLRLGYGVNDTPMPGKNMVFWEDGADQTWVTDDDVANYDYPGMPWMD